MLEFCHVNVSCGLVPVLDDISVTFQTGEITTVIGPNGCGKTTLLQCLNGSSKVTSGSIRLDETDYLALPLKDRARRLSFLPQVRTVIPTLPVRTLVEHGRFPHLGFSRKKSQKDVAIVENAMDFAHVSPYAAQYADTLSGGIRQRAFFAMTLAQDCSHIVLDEPTTYLDLNGQREFMEMIQQLKKEGRTVILVLHDLGQALRISDTLVIMQDKQIAATATPEECLQQHIIEDIFDVRIKEFSDDEGRYYFFY
ncbi:MAG: ABC transporter ATP-binding protein [Lachnospiraceae bacterium]|nr:ABC transporter ATP-binding protein [Lachnospiraceae bacterium]